MRTRVDMLMITACVLAGSSCSSVKTGTWMFLHSNGELSTGCFRYTKDDTLNDATDESLQHADGKKIVWWKTGGIKFYESYYKDGEPDGLWLIWHQNGNIKCIGHNSNGKRVGRWTWFDSRGRKKSEEIFEDDIYTEIEFWPNGQKKEEKVFHAGSKIPRIYKWNPNGVLLP